jgi:uncharacterized protein (TIGR02449 family)
MENLYLHLEVQVKALLQKCEALQQANDSLHQSKTSLLREKELLQVKHNIAIAKIEEMVSRLKSIELTL